MVTLHCQPTQGLRVGFVVVTFIVFGLLQGPVYVYIYSDRVTA